jgi:hypothetical protein
VEDAMENCDYLNVLLTHHTFIESSALLLCRIMNRTTAKWMRIDHKGAIDKKANRAKGKPWTPNQWSRCIHP